MATPSAVLDEVSFHLQKVNDEPTTALDTDLLERGELFTSTPQYQASLWKDSQSLFLQVASLLPRLQQDPTPLIHFILKLAEPYPFGAIKDVEFEIGLDLQAIPFHGLLLTLLGKATANSADAQALANRPTVMQAVVRLWLCTADAGIATQAEDLLISLLIVSKNEPASISNQDLSHIYGNGPMWRRLFGDRDIASLYYHYTSLKQLTSPPLPLLSPRDKTIAQARLLSWLPRVGRLDWNAIVSSYELQTEREVGLKPAQGLLHYAALKMVDTVSDVLMYMTLLNFYSVLITTVVAKPHLTCVEPVTRIDSKADRPRHYDSSLSLDFVKDEGIHKSIVDLHTSDTPSLDQSFLSSRSSQYISDYASTYPENFENSSELPVIRNYVHRNIRKCEPSTLNIIASMPRSTLVPRRGTTLVWDDCVILDMPITRTNADALKTLATVFHGPPKSEITFPKIEEVGLDPKRTSLESTFARLLTGLFYSKKPNMFSDLVTHMDTIAMKENALAALTLVRALVTATWSTYPIPDIVPTNDPTFARLANFPKSGLDLILDATLSGGVLPSLLKPATSFSNLVGGRGDAENAAYQVAMAKFDVLKALGQKLEEEGGRQDVLAMVRRRVAEGPWGVGGSAGSRIGTLEL